MRWISERLANAYDEGCLNNYFVAMKTHVYKAALRVGLGLIGLSLLLFVPLRFAATWQLMPTVILFAVAGATSLVVCAVSFVWNRKQWRTPLLILAALTAVALATHFALAKRSERERQLEYQTITNLYAEELREGSSRESVERYLRSEGKEFQRFCCVDVPRNAWADRVRIGQEHAPWFCRQHNVYVAFVFDAPARSLGQPQSEDGSDRLVEVKLHPALEGCL